MPIARSSVRDVRTSPRALTDNFSGADANPYTVAQTFTWLQADPTRLSPLQVVNHRVFGTATAAAGGSGPYNDANGYVSGMGNDHEVVATIYRNPAAAGSPNLEVECLLRWADNGTPRTTTVGTTSARGYECNLSHIGAYWILANFMEPGELARAASPPTPATGDIMRLRVVGNRIQAYYTPLATGIETLHIDYTDTGGAGGGPLFTDGNPGIGFYCDNGGVLTDFGFSSVTVRPL